MKRRAAVAAVAAAAIMAALLYAWHRPARHAPASGAEIAEEAPALASRVASMAPGRSATLAAAMASAADHRPSRTRSRLAETTAELLPRAQRGDAAAAVQLFHETLRCLAAAQVLANAHAPGSLAGMPDEASLDGFQEQVEEARRTRTDCGEDEPVDDGRIYSVALRAADLGDETAACYYVNSPLLVSDGRLAREHGSDLVGTDVGEVRGRIDPRIVGAYVANGERIAQRGIERGDWNMVWWLRDIHQSNRIAFVIDPLVRPDPEAAYRYTRLWVLGEPEPSRRQALADSAHEGAAEEGGLSASQIAGIDAWAQETFRKYFSPRPLTPTPSQFRICSLPPLHGLD